MISSRVMLQPKTTASVFVHLHANFVRKPRIVEACQGIINSGQAGNIHEYVIQTMPSLLTHTGTVITQKKGSTYEIPGIEEFRRIMLFGGSFLMPASMYESEDHPNLNLTREAAKCHMQAFTTLVDAVRDQKESTEFHFCSEALYYSAARFDAEAYDWVLTSHGNPPFERKALEWYMRAIDSRGISFNAFLKDELVFDASNPRIVLYYWEKTEDLLAALTNQPQS